MIISGDTIEGVVQPAQRIWNTWGMHMLVLFSFALQVALIVLAGVRRRKDSSIVRAVLWLAYTLADTIAVYALGHFFVTSRSAEHMLMALWAPLLLVHLGGQDNITAYSLEDNALWMRHLQNMGVQILAAAYVLYQSSILSRPTKLRAATILMFVVGVLKYFERVWALFLSGDWDDQEFVMRPDVLPGSFRGEWPPAEETGYHETEILVSAVYDQYYTKTDVIFTRFGMCTRVISLLATVVAVLLFHQFSDEDGLNSLDATATYILLVGALVLEITSMLSQVFSFRTVIVLKEQEWKKFKWIGGLLESFREGVYRSLQKAGIHTMYWSGSMGQLDFIQLCNRNIRPRKILGWMKPDFSRSIPVPTEIIQIMLGSRKWHIDEQFNMKPGLAEEMDRLIRWLQLDDNQDFTRAAILSGLKMILLILGEKFNFSFIGSDIIHKDILDKLVSKEMEGSRNWDIPAIVSKLMEELVRIGNIELHYLGIRLMGFEEEIESLLRKDDPVSDILVWHIATHVFFNNCSHNGLKQEPNGQHPSQGIAEATEALSNYAFFLISAHPLPEADYSFTMKNVVEYCKCIGGLQHIRKLIWEHGAKSLNFQGSYDDGQFKYAHRHERISTLITIGFELGGKLISKGMSRDIFVAISHLWVHMLMMVEKKMDKDFHVKQAARGGEFLTVLHFLEKYRRKKERQRHEE